MKDHCGIPRNQNGLKQFTITCLLPFMLVYGIRALIIFHYGVNCPFEDEWDGIGRMVYLPFLNHQFLWTNLYIPHAEHHMFFTRLLGLITFITAHHQWHPLLIMAINSLFPAVTASLFIFWYYQDFKKIDVISYLLIIAIFATPLDVDNILMAFQTHFYCIALFSVVALRLVSTGNSTSTKRCAAVILFSVFAYLNMASGALTPFVAGFLYLYLAFFPVNKIKTTLFGISLLLITLVMMIDVHYLLLHNNSLRVTSIFAFLDAFTDTLVWRNHYGILFWIPLIFFAYKIFSTKQYDVRKYLFPLALYAWVILQCTAMAYARGGYARRYSVYFFISIAALVFILDHLKNDKNKKWINGYKAIVLIIFMTLSLQKGVDWLQSYQESELNELATLQTVMIMSPSQETQGLAFLKTHPLPYPDAKRVWDWAHNADFLSILPHEITQPLLDKDKTSSKKC
jgi:hypothetical protein